jgi:hypothetical protein
MDETVLLKMLDEIDSMTSEEYWEFFNESQKLTDYLLGWVRFLILVMLNHKYIFYAPILYSASFPV